MRISRLDPFRRLLCLGGAILGGASLAIAQDATGLDKSSFGTKLDYFCFYNQSAGGNPPGNSPVWSTGLWSAYDFTKAVGVALRAQFLSDSHGVDASGGALGFPNLPGTGQDLSSVALTLNLRPTPNIKFQPEIRFDHSPDARGRTAARSSMGGTLT